VIFRRNSGTTEFKSTDAIEQALAGSRGIDLRDCRLMADDEFTLADINRSIEWDVWDDLSYGDTE
jgi:hypothetical protein